VVIQASQCGSNAARLMMERGYKIVGIAEFDGGLSNPKASTFTSCWNTSAATTPFWVSAAQRPCQRGAAGF